MKSASPVINPPAGSGSRRPGESLAIQQPKFTGGFQVRCLKAAEKLIELQTQALMNQPSRKETISQTNSIAASQLPERIKAHSSVSSQNINSQEKLQHPEIPEMRAEAYYQERWIELG